MNKLFRLAIVLASFVFPARAQYTISAGNSTLEIGGVAATYYNQRFLKPGIEDYKKNKFALRNLRLYIEGRTGNAWQYKLNVDFASIANGSVDPENPGIVDAWVSYNALPVHIKLGYDKIPYSQGSLNSIFNSAFWSRGILTDGSMFNRRDMGLTLSSSLWKQRINVYGGVYSGLGERLFAVGDNDASGALEYAGRVDVAFPSRYRNREVDVVGVPIPMFRVGANVRYTNKTQPNGATISDALVDDYHLIFVNGERLLYGFDASFMYRNISAQFEMNNVVMHPSSQNDVLYANTTPDVNKGVVKAGGYLAQVNYCWLKAHSVISARYQNVNLNDLIYGNEEWLFLGYAYQINGFKNCIKIQYYKPLKEDVKSDPLKWTDQIRIGWQYVF